MTEPRRKPLPAVVNGVKFVRAPDAGYAVDVPPLVKRIATIGGLELMFKTAPRVFERHQTEVVNLAVVTPKRRAKAQTKLRKDGQPRKRMRAWPDRRVHPNSLDAMGLGYTPELRRFLQHCEDETILTDLILRELTTACRRTHLYAIYQRFLKLREAREIKELWRLYDEFRSQKSGTQEE